VIVLGSQKLSLPARVLERLHFFDPATGAAIAPAGTPAAPG
jgi:hypothetical protein